MKIKLKLQSFLASEMAFEITRLDQAKEVRVIITEGHGNDAAILVTIEELKRAVEKL